MIICVSNIHMGMVSLSLHLDNKATWKWLILVKWFPSYNWATVSGNLASLSKCCCLRLILSSSGFTDAVFLVLGCSDKSHFRVKRQQPRLTLDTWSRGPNWFPLEHKISPVSFWTCKGYGHMDEHVPYMEN